MISRWRKALAGVVLGGLAVVPARAQSDRPWIDPPRATPEAAPSVSPAPPASPPAPPQRRSDASAAQELAVAYLDYWSAPNAVTLDATPEFYAPRVEFHGKLMSARTVFEEKRRFVHRWPERHYTPRLDTMRSVCDPGSQTCVVRTMFDFAAMNPARGRRSEGTADLELIVSLEGPEPVIVAETSRVLRRGGIARAEGRDSGSLENDED